VRLLYKLYVVLPPGVGGAPRFVFAHADAAAPLSLRADGAGALLLDGQLAALAGMRRGGRRRAVLPPRLGFGSDGNALVPAAATLLCFLEVLPEPQGAGTAAGAELLAATTR
jgi:hypothetical protein